VTGRLIIRVQWRHRHWGPTTSTKSRTFTREADAHRFAAKIRGNGGVAFISTASRGPWIVANEVAP